MRSRRRVFRAALGAMLFAQMGLCPRLWTSDRAFPTVPAFAGLPPLPSFPTAALVGLFLVAVLAASVSRHPRLPCRWVVGLGVFLVLFDVNRLQPWFYFDLLFFGVFASETSDPQRDHGGRGYSPAGSRIWGEETRTACGWLLVATYFWSGVQKTNLSFATRVFPWLLHPFGLDRLVPLWPLAPLFEIGVAVGLIFPRTRTAALVGLSAMHAVLLFVLGPWGQNFNSVVLPWNALMPVLAFALFFRNPAPLMPKGPWQPAMIVAGLAAVLPVLNFVGLWDENLSASLYSGKSPEGFLFLTEAGASHLPAEIRPFVQRRSDRIGIDLARWSLAEMNVPVYPAVRVYRQIARDLVNAGVPSGEIRLIVVQRGQAVVVPF